MADISIVLHAGPGMDDYTLHLANALSEFARVGFSVSEAMLTRYGDALSPRVTSLVFKRPRRRDLWGFAEMSRVARNIHSFKPNIFHLQNDGLWESVLLIMLGSLPIVNTVHDPVKHIDQRNLLNHIFQWVAIRHACGWIVHSENLKDLFVHRFQVDPMRVLVHPLGTHDYYARFASPNAQREKTILFFGELRRNKGCDILLRAFESLELSDWRVIVAGQGNGLDDEGNLIKSLGKRLDFRPRFIPDVEVADLFSRAGVVALPYRHGSQSAVLAIAAAFACPTLITKVGSYPELVEHAKQVFFVLPDSEEELRQGLLTLTQNLCLRVELGKNLYKLSCDSWSWKDIAERTVAFYKQILNK
jgi:glycosyltransferase involved in cell wall biosynthesis